MPDNVDKSKADSNHEGEKTYTTGSDASAGFAVPADYSGGEETQEMVTMIENGQIKGERDYALSLLAAYQKAVTDWQLKKQALDHTRSSLRSLSDTVQEAVDAISEKQSSWHRSSVRTTGNRMQSDDIVDAKSSLSMLKEAVADMLELKEIMGEEALAYLEDAMTKVKETNPSVINDMVGGDGNLSLAKTALEYASRSLERDATNRGAASKDDFNMSDDNLKTIKTKIRSLVERHRSGSSKSSRIDESQVNKTELTEPPNYREAIDSSPRVCGNCRFFEGGKDVVGHCEAYHQDVRADYVCATWQSEPSAKSSTKAVDVPDNAPTPSEGGTGWRSPMNRVDVNPERQTGRVGGQQVITQAEDYHHTIQDVDYVDDEKIRAANKNFLPGDIVYSASLNSNGIVRSGKTIDGIRMYNLDLINAGGIKRGVASCSEGDLQMRSKFAYKGITYVKSSKSVATVDDVVEVTRNVYQAIRSVVEAHRDYGTNKITDEDVLSPLKDDIVSVLKSDMFKSIKTGRKRKYYRAIQTAMSAIGAARMILHDYEKTFNNTSRKATEEEELRVQSDVYDRMKRAMQSVYDALVLPSATHGDEAPGVKTMRNATESVVRALKYHGVDYDNRFVESDTDGIVYADIPSGNTDLLKRELARIFNRYSNMNLVDAEENEHDLSLGIEINVSL